METLYIETSQNVEIEHSIASVGERLLAQLLDYCFIFAYVFIMIFVETFAKFSGIVFGVLLFLPLLVYDLFFEIVYNGQNPGKMILKLKVVKLDGSAPSISSYLLRWIFRIIDILLIFGSIAVITILINGKGQRLGDIAAGTTVIKLKRKYKLQDSILTHLQNNYSPTYNEARMLEETDIKTIKEVILFTQSNPRSTQNMHIGEKTKSAIEKKLGITSNQNYLAFLQTILNDYHFLYTESSSDRH